jgi:hypothetical protein
VRAAHPLARALVSMQSLLFALTALPLAGVLTLRGGKKKPA